MVNSNLLCVLKYKKKYPNSSILCLYIPNESQNCLLVCICLFNLSSAKVYVSYANWTYFFATLIKIAYVVSLYLLYRVLMWKLKIFNQLMNQKRIR